jgi:hypothetical protein
MEKRSGVKARWIAVNTTAMSVDHEPESAFEKKAAEELAAGKDKYSRVEKGYYLEARPVPLGAGCIGCHTKQAPITDKKPRFAGLDPVRHFLFARLEPHLLSERAGDSKAGASR